MQRKFCFLHPKKYYNNSVAFIINLFAMEGILIKSYFSIAENF